MALLQLAEAPGDLSPALHAIGEDLVQSTKDRFVSGAWPDTIHYQLDGTDTLLIGSNQEYAGAQPFGMPKGYAGKTKRGAPIPWGDIPPQPLLGLSDEDRSGIPFR